MDRPLVPSSRSYDFGNGNEVISVPIKWPTVITLSELFKNEGKSNIEKFTEALKKDSDLCSFITNYFTEGTQLRGEHGIMSTRKRKFSVEESGNNEGTTIGETTKDVDQARDDFWARLLWSPRNPIEKLMQSHEFPLSIAERVGNDEELVAIAEKILKPFRQDSDTFSLNAQEYSQIVDLFWGSKKFHKALLEELDEYPFAFSDISKCARKFIEEPPEDRIARIKMNPSLGKVFEGDGPLAKLCGAQSILFGYWASRDLLAKLAGLLDSPDLRDPTRRGIKGWRERSL